MTRWRTILMVLIGLELLAGALLVGRRLASTQLSPLGSGSSHDALTEADLRALPDQFLFDSLEKWTTLGKTYLAFGHFAKAEACLRRASEAGAPLQIVFLHGYTLERLGLVPEAEAVYRDVAEGATGLLKSRSWYRAGRLALQQEHPEEALNAFEQAGETHWAAVYQRAKLKVRAGDMSAAGPFLKSLTERHPEDIHVLYLREQAARFQGDLQESREVLAHLERAGRTISLDDGLEESLNPIRNALGMSLAIAIAVELQDSGQTAAAVQRLSGLIGDETRWQNQYPMLLEDAIGLLVHAGDTVAARRYLQQQLETYGYPTATAWELQGDVELAEGHREAARRAWERSLQLRPTADVHFKLGQLLHPGQESDARRHFGLAAQFAGRDAFQDNRLPDARKRLRESTGADPELPEAWFWLGATEHALGDLQAAREAWRRCIQLNRQHGRALTRLEWLDGQASGGR